MEQFNRLKKQIRYKSGKNMARLFDLKAFEEAYDPRTGFSMKRLLAVAARFGAKE